jgi:hypothetical protein
MGLSLPRFNICSFGIRSHCPKIERLSSRRCALGLRMLMLMLVLIRLAAVRIRAFTQAVGSQDRLYLLYCFVILLNFMIIRYHLPAIDSC